MRTTLFTFVLAITLFSCKKDNSSALTTYKYADKPQTLNCSNIDTKLFTEAYYAFENAVLINAQNTNRIPGRKVNLDYAFRNFTARSQNNLRIQDYITEEAANIFKVLKTKNIWDGNHLNYNSDVVKCIEGSILNPQLKQTFKTLHEVNSLSPKLMAAAIYGNFSDRNKFKDKALMTYVALDMFYAKMQDVDFSKVKYLVKKDPAAITPPINRKNIRATTPQIGKPIKLNTKKAK